MKRAPIPVGTHIVIQDEDNTVTGIVTEFYDGCRWGQRWYRVRMTSGPTDGEIRSFFWWQINYQSTLDEKDN